MGASESTAKTNYNATGDDHEEKMRHQQQSSAGTSIGDAMALAAAGMESLLTNSSQILEAFGERSVWSPPPSGRFKLNTDGGCHSIRGRPYNYPQEDCRVERRPSGYGGILRDHRGKWVRGFRGFIGVTDSFTAELHGIHKGLELLDKLGHKGAILESDCQAAVDWMNEKDNTSKSKIVRESWSIIVECRRLAHNNNIEIVHVKGDDANICAHKLADLAIDKEDKYVELEYLSQIILEAGFDGKRSIWSPPPSGRFKLNTDGGCHSIRGRPYDYPQDDCGADIRPSGYGGILRDHRGKWVRGFRGYIGVTDSLTAELHGIQKGLELLDKLGHKGAILESDCKGAVEFMNNNNTSKRKIVCDSWSIIVECRRLAHNNNIEIVHVKRDNNICAHKLADLAIDKEDKYVEIEDLSQLPDDIKRLVDKDALTIIGYPSSNSHAY